MGSPTTIHPFPELASLAEEEARDIWTRHVRLFRERLPDMEVVADPHDASDGFAVTVDAQVERLCDLTRPASRDAVARLVAARVGTDLAGVHQRLALPGFPLLRLYDYCGVPDTAQGNGEHAPAEALTLIVRHLWPEDSTDAR